MVDEKEVDTILQKRLKQIELEKKLTETCEGIDCIKVELEKLRNSHKAEFEKLHNKYNCPECGQKTLEVGDSFCRNCGNTIESWDELEGWIPYFKRIAKGGK